MKPSSITSPPNTVTSRAWTAALRFSRASPLWPTSRNDVTDVSSQNRYSVSRSSARTSPSITPAKASRSAALRVPSGELSPK
jgi:hypothetical protein